jgi:STE24 endopeptidase
VDVREHGDAPRLCRGIAFGRCFGALYSVLAMGGHRYRLPLAVALAVAAAGVATLVLRPRGGLIEAAAVDPTAYFTAEQLDRAQDYRGPQRLLALGGVAASGLALGVLGLRPPRAFARLCHRVEARPLAGGAVVGASIVLVLTVVGLPFGLAGWDRAVDVGLSTQSLGGWLSDLAKSTAVSVAFGAAGGLLAVMLMRRFPRHWWAPAGAVVIAFGVLVTYLSPVVLDPLFNRFEPLPDGELRAAVLELGERADVDIGEVYRVDASRRTTASNAYVGGLGETKRVVLYDNLIEDLPQEQVRSVVAHELAHVRYSDLPRGLLWLAIVALPSMLVVQRLTELIDHRSRPDRDDAGIARGSPAGLPAVALSLAVVAFAVQIPANWLSRQVEARADAYALGLTQEPAAFIGLQRSLAVRNVSEPDPPALYHGLLGTHPTTAQRIGLGLDWAEER